MINLKEKYPLWKMAILADPESFGLIPASLIPAVSATSTASVEPAKKGYCVVKATAYLKSHYQPSSIGKCAMYVRLAMEAGGANTDGRPNSAKDYKPILERIGYRTIPSSTMEFKLGDIAVFQPPYPEHLHGHIQMWDGTKWGSDFRQNSFYAGPKYRDNPVYEIFRYEAS